MAGESGDLALRAATVADRAALVRLLSAQSAVHRMAAGAEEVGRAVELALAPSASAWLAVAVRSGIVVGVLLANPIVSVEYGGGALWIEELYVEPAHRRRGVARALYGFIADEARRAGLGAIELEVDPSLEAAEPFWRSLGFSLVERRRYDRAL